MRVPSYTPPLPVSGLQEDLMYGYGIGGLVVAVIVILLILFLLGVI